MIDGYLTIREVAERWGISKRRVQILCARGRIEGAIRFRNEWVIPENALRPADRRITTGQYKNWRKRSSEKDTESFT